MLVLLPVKTDAISEEKCYKRYAIRFSCSSSDKMIFILLIKVKAGYVVITLINVRKICLEAIFRRAFYSCGFGFH